MARSPFIFNGNYAKALVKYLRLGNVTGNIVDILHGSADPSAGAGVEADEGSIYLRYAGGAATLWQKDSDGTDTDWTENTSGLTDHGLLSGLADDDHAQYALLAGRTTGQTLIGGIASEGKLVLQSTSSSTKGKVFLGQLENSYFDESTEEFKILTSVESPLIQGSQVSGGDLTLSSTSNATKGSLLFGASQYDEVNDRLILNSTASTLDIVASTHSAIFSVHKEGSASTDIDILMQRNGATAPIAPHMVFARTRGTEASPTAIQNGDILGTITAVGYDGTDYNPFAAIEFKVNFTSGTNDAPGGIFFYTTSDGSNTLTERARLDHAGTFWVTTEIQTPTIKGSISANGDLRLLSTSHGTKGDVFFGAGSTTKWTESTEKFTLGGTFVTTAQSNRLANFTISDSSITASSNIISFGSAALSTTGNIQTNSITCNTTASFVTSVQTPLIFGNTTSGANLTLQSTSNATKGSILIDSAVMVNANIAGDNLIIDPNNAYTGAAHGNADNFVIRHSTSQVGMSILASTVGSCNLFFGEDVAGSGNNINGRITYANSTNVLSFFANNTFTFLMDGSTTTIIGDFVVDADTLFVDSSANRVGIGATVPTSKLTIETADPSITGDKYLNLLHTGVVTWSFYGTGTSDRSFTIGSGSTPVDLLTIERDDVGGGVIITNDLTVDTNTLYVDSTNNRVGIGTITPGEPLSVAGGDIETTTTDTGIILGAGTNRTTLRGGNSGFQQDIHAQGVIDWNTRGLTTSRHITFSHNGTSAMILRGGAASGTLGIGDVQFLFDIEVSGDLYAEGNAGIGIQSPTAKLHVDQSSTTAAVPVVKLDQGDVSEPFIDFIGTSGTGSANSLSTGTTSGVPNGWIQIDVNGVQKWLRTYAAPSA